MPMPVTKTVKVIHADKDVKMPVAVIGAKAMHQIKGFNPVRIQKMPEKVRHIKPPHKTLRKLLTTVQHVVSALQKDTFETFYQGDKRDKRDKFAFDNAPKSASSEHKH
jgi:hypothetical protein